MRRACVVCGLDYLPRKKARELGVLYCSKSCSNRARKRPLADRFAASYVVGEPTACWPWLGSVDKDGYGYLSSEDGRRQIGAHRFAYERLHGPVPPGKQVMHACDNPPCVNPAHLSVGTCDENNKDKARKLRAWSKLTASDVKAIRVRLASGEAMERIAKDFGVTGVNIFHIKHRHSWRHLE